MASTTDDGSKGSPSEFPHVFGIPLRSMSRTARFFTLVCGVMFFYLLYGYIQEWIFRIEGFKPYGWYLTLVQFGYYTIFGLLQMVIGDYDRRIPLQIYLFLAFLTVSTMGLSNTSLGYLNYPTQVIFKSCKLIPVMIGGILIQEKRYGMLDFISVLSMCVGLVFFVLADNKVQPNFDSFGVLLISLALCADAVIGNVQEKAVRDNSGTAVEVVFFSYGIGFVYILIGLTVTGGLWPAFNFSLHEPLKVYGGAFVFSVTGFIGISFVLGLVRLYGALLAVTVTTLRKAVTLVISFLVFSKPFTMQYVYSGSVVLFGIALNVYTKNKETIDEYIKGNFVNKKPRMYKHIDV